MARQDHLWMEKGTPQELEFQAMLNQYDGSEISNKVPLDDILNYYNTTEVMEEPEDNESNLMKENEKLKRIDSA